MTGRLRLQGERPLKREVCMPGFSPELECLSRWQLSYLGGGPTPAFSSPLSHSSCPPLTLSNSAWLHPSMSEISSSGRAAAGYQS